MFKNLLLGIGLSGLALVSANASVRNKSYKVTLPEPYTVGSTQLKAGGYELVVDGSKAMLEDSRGKVQANGTLKSEAQKFGNTAILSAKMNGTEHLQAIDLGGTRLQVDFQ